MDSKYEIIIYWSEEDNAFIAEVPELPGCMADGKTYQEAFRNAEIIIFEWIEQDTIWDTWDNYYIASFGMNMPENETIGKINPEIFPGILNHYYIELRIPEINQN